MAEREELDALIAGLAKRLGVTVEAGARVAMPGQGSQPRLGGDPVKGTSEGEYFGFVSTKAAGEVLQKFGSRQHPLKTKDIFDAVKKGGVEISGEDALYRSLARSRHFRKVGRGLWGLSEWYPPRVAKSAAKSAVDGVVLEEVADGEFDDSDGEMDEQESVGPDEFVA